MKNKQLLLGFTAAILYFFWKLLVLSQGKQHEWLASFPVAPLLALLGISIFISITRFSENPLSFSDNFKAGARTSLIAGLTAGALVFVYYKIFDPEFMPIRIQEQLELGRAAGESAENLKKGEENMQSFFSPFWFSTFTVSGTAFFGMMFSLIVSALKRAFKVI